MENEPKGKSYDSMTLDKLYIEKRGLENQIAALKKTAREIAAVIEIKHTEEKVAGMNDTQKDSLRQVLGKG